MSAKIMNKTRFARFQGFIREFSETLSSPGNGDSIFIPRGVQSIPVALNPTYIEATQGEGYVEYTLSSVANVNADNAIWKKWDTGNVIVYADEVLYPCTAIRLVNVSGKTDMFGSAR